MTSHHAALAAQLDFYYKGISITDLTVKLANQSAAEIHPSRRDREQHTCLSSNESIFTQDSSIKSISSVAKDFLQEEIDCSTISDYQNFAETMDSMWLVKIRKKAISSTYWTAEDCRADIHQILKNSDAYNAPGCGSQSSTGMIPPPEKVLQRYSQFGAEKITEFLNLQTRRISALPFLGQLGPDFSLAASNDHGDSLTLL